VTETTMGCRMADERPHGSGDGGSPMRGRRELLSAPEAAFVQPSGGGAATPCSAARPSPCTPARPSSVNHLAARRCLLHTRHDPRQLPSVPASLIISARCFALRMLPRLRRSPFPTASSVLASVFLGAAHSTAILLLVLLGRRPCAEGSCVLAPIPSVERAPPQTEQLCDWH
jgi:hypothetical protein